MPWHPPIPLGALYTEEALQLGPALSLLGYCYDKVSRDGSALRLNLRTAAGEMGVPYPTVKRWWELLKDTSYIASHKERGRAGMDVHMSDDWLDWWREDRETRSKVIPNKRGTGQKREKNERKIVSEMIPNNSAYKDVSRSSDQGGSEDRDRTERTHPPAATLFWEYYPETSLSEKEIALISSTATDLTVWRTSLDIWYGNNWPPKIGNLLDRYRKELTRGHTNGTHQPSRHASPTRRTSAIPKRLDLDD